MHAVLTSREDAGVPLTPPLDLASLPAEPGVYRFWDADGRVLYIGRAVDVRRRVRSYWGSLKGRPRMRRMVPQIVRVEVAVCASEHEAAWLERNLLERSKPRWNRARGGLEVPVYLRLDDGPKAPGLTVTHDAPPAPLDSASAHGATAAPTLDGGLPHFGPYLGGTRVRAAVTALGTVYPLAYTGDALAGAERSMAQARGVTSADRAELAASLQALLTRDGDAIAAAVARLESRRADAARDLEFELAGRIQEQLEAVQWLVSPQCVTGAGSPPIVRGNRAKPDAIAAGWADGILVEFGLSGGRVCTWAQRAASAGEAGLLAAATPPHLAEFAQRNAELAAATHALHV